MEDITSFIDRLEGKGKRHVLLIVTPKGNYPNQFSGKEYDKLEYSILLNPKSFISLFEEGEKEIMQYVAFRLFLKPVICDSYRLYNKQTIKLKRMGLEEIESFMVTKRFYSTVPYNEETEQEAINIGVNEFKHFIRKYPFEQFEFATVYLDKDSEEANLIPGIDFTNKNKNEIYFDYVYVY